MTESAIAKANADPRKVPQGRSISEAGLFLEANTIKEAFRPQDFDYVKLTGWFETSLRRKHSSFVSSLRACAAAGDLYARLPDSTVASSIVANNSLHRARWIPNWEPAGAPLLRAALSRPQAFACIAMFDSGRVIDPDYLKNVFAITSGNSIFVASPMLSDPYDTPVETEIKRVHGNIGQPGLSFLIPPPAPLVRKANQEAWTLLSHNEFTGAREDSFGKTSMHLRLTQYKPELPGLYQDEHYIEEGMALRETLVQVYDGGDWVCDLDVLSALRDPLLSRVVCKHSEAGGAGAGSSTSTRESRPQAPFRMVTVDNWEELLTPPTDQARSVVRTAGNWLGRLAVAGVSVRLRRPTIILPEEVCWDCVEKHIWERQIPVDEARRIVLIM
jgi:hypothetical protein